ALVVTVRLVSLRRPRCSPLFPYTTLFRSGHGGAAEVVGRQSAHVEVRGGRDRDRLHPRVDAVGEAGGQHRREAPLPVDPPAARVDRKSTRLNSSHVKISYAVFCLKKKKHK